MATKLYLPNLLEYIYAAIVEKGFKHLFNRLEREDYLKVKNEAKARKFAEFANLEEKIIMMAQLGYGCSVIFWDKEKQKKTKVEDILISYIDVAENDMTKVLVKDKVFSCRDIDFIKSMQTMSHASMSKSYSINRKFLEIKESAVLKTRTLVSKLEADASLEWYSKTIQFALNIEPTLEVFKIDIVKLRILLYLQTCPNGATKDNISTKLNRINITGVINELYSNSMVDFSLTNSNVVTIDTYGIMVLEQIIAKFP